MTLVYQVHTHAGGAAVERLVRRILDLDQTARVLVSHDRHGDSQVVRMVDALPRTDVLLTEGGYADFSHVRRWLEAVDWLREHDVEYSWVSTLTGADYPVRHLGRVADELAATEADAFIEHFDVLGPDSPWGRARGYSRYWFHYARWGQLGGRLRDTLRFAQVLNRIQPWVRVNVSNGLALGVRAASPPFSSTWPCLGGSFFTTVRREVAEHILEHSEAHVDLVRYFERTLSPAEAFFQSVIVNDARFNVVNDCRRYFDFSTSRFGHPRVLGLADAPAALASGADFARKLPLHGGRELRDVIDAAVDRTEHSPRSGAPGGAVHSPLSVTAVVATRDRPELLRKTLAGIHDQTYDGPIQTVVVYDQAEPDESLRSSDPHRPVDVVRNDRTPGLAGARNTGICCAEGEVIALCDDDDVWLPTKISQQVALLDACPWQDVVVGGMTVVYGDREIVRIWGDDHLTISDLIRSRVQDVHPSTIAVRTRAVRDHIGLVDERLPGSYGEDHDWLIRAARHQPITVLRSSLVEVLWHPDSFFADRWRTIADALEYLVDKHPEFRRDRQGLARMRGRQAFAFAATQRPSIARRTALQALASYPLDRRAIVALIVSTGLVSAARAQSMANALGRGI